MTTDRVPCEVPFCRRTAPRAHFPAEDVEIICSKHWRPVRPSLKAEYRHLKRLARRAHARGKQMPALQRRLRTSWDRCKASAVEAAAGLA